MENINENKIKSGERIAEVEPIQKSRDVMIRTRAEISEFVEPPLVLACERLWDLNIRTLSSSANRNDIGRDAYINIDFDSLSDENRNIARENGLLEEDGSTIRVTIPINSSISVEQLQEAANASIKSFKRQAATWIPSYSLEEMKEIMGYSIDDQSISPKTFTREGFFYSANNNRFYLSEEHYKKTLENLT